MQHILEKLYTVYCATYGRQVYNIKYKKVLNNVVFVKKYFFQEGLRLMSEKFLKSKFLNSSLYMQVLMY